MSCRDCDKRMDGADGIDRCRPSGLPTAKAYDEGRCAGFVPMEPVNIELCWCSPIRPRGKSRLEPIINGLTQKPRG